ncbi:MAG: RagB/SusD family nutrient uptake outer membrane protein [Flavobacteriaceae bacterium]|nr:RagB/SusD family nutrient uptake outer membrane protein [Flavobacteriaceae bacterium]
MLRKIQFLFLVVALIGLTSCEKDFLDTKPTDSISDADAFASTENMFLVLNGLHRQMYAQSPLPGGSSSRAGQQYFMPMFDVYCGDLIHSARANGWMRAGLQWLSHTDSNSTSVEQLWYQRYHFITTANNLIDNIAANDAYSDSDPDIANILGQAYAYRAWAYHVLVSTYGKGYLIGNPASDLGVPIILQAGAPYESAPRSTVAEVYAQIESDIAESIKHFQNASAPKNKSHLSLNAAYGIQARVALQKGDWATAATAAENARSGFPLMSESDWKSGFNTVSLSEVIWGSTVIDAETTYYRSYFYLISPTFNGSQNRGNPKLVNIERYNQIPTTDYRKDVFLPMAPNTNGAASNGEGGSYETDPNYSDAASFAAAKAEIINKYGMTSRHNTHPYMHVKFLQKNPGTIDPDDLIHMRASEMYLIEAEAKAMQNDIRGAQEALRPLGEARDTAYDETVYDDQDKLMEHIRFQRAIELYGEGFSWHDHIRWDIGIDLTNSGAAQVLYQNGFQQDKPSTNNAWIWKIPQAEIDANPNISEAEQNK